MEISIRIKNHPQNTSTEVFEVFCEGLRVSKKTFQGIVLLRKKVADKHWGNMEMIGNVHHAFLLKILVFPQTAKILQIPAE